MRSLAIAYLALCAMSMWTCVAQPVPPNSPAAKVKRVMVLHSFGRDFKPWSEYGNAIRAELERQSRWPIDILDYSLVTARLGGEEAELAFVEYQRVLFAKHPLDLIISIGAPAAAFVQRHRKHFFGDIPMVLTAVDQRRVQFSSLTANDAVVAVHIDYLAAFENIVRVLPDTENVIVVVGTSPIEKFWKEAIAKEVEPVTHRIKLSWTDHLSFEQLLQEASKLPPRTAIFWELMIVDAAGVVHEANTAIAKLHAAANAPIFSYDESFFGEGMVGGPFLHVIDTSRQTAEVAVRILGGERADHIKVAPIQFANPVFDWRQLRRWNISESQLPPGSDIRFRQLSAWDQYRWQILAIAAAVLFQAGLIQWLLRERRQRQRSEVLARNTMAELAHMNRVATASEMSASIAHEVMQPLTGMVASANAGLRWLAASTPDLDKVRTTLTQIVNAGHRTADVVRAIRAAFRKDMANKQPIRMNGLIDEVVSLAGTDLGQHDIAVEERLDENLPVITGDPVQLQQVVFNLITNAIDAMEASPIAERVLGIRSEIDEGGIRVSVEDNGPGVGTDQLDQIFAPMFTTKTQGMGLGLAICRSIVDAHHGRIWALHRQPHGLVVQFYLPIDQPGA
jgi:signal transduction histidine kinase